MNSRWKNYGLWVSIFAFIPMVCQTFNIIKIPGDYDTLVTSFLSILVLLGIVNSPTTDNKWYLDDKLVETVNLPELIEEKENPEDK